jgi:hypothetical protein
LNPTPILPIFVEIMGLSHPIRGRQFPSVVLKLYYSLWLSSVVLLFFGTHKCVLNKFLGLFWPMDSCVDHGIRMTVSSMFFVLIATPLGSHEGSCLVIHSGHPPHIVTLLIHEYHGNVCVL